MARELHFFGNQADGYFTSDKFCLQVAKAALIADFKYPADKYDVVWVFDQAKIHLVYDDDALVASQMNVNPGGSQPKMRTSRYDVNGRPQSMVLENGQPKGMKRLLEEREVDVRGMKKEDMQGRLNEFDDFKNEKNKVERILNRFGHRVIYLPKFHPELNPIERVWGKAKRYTRDHCDYSYEGLKRNIYPALESVTLDDIRKYFRKSRDYLHAFNEGYSGFQADQKVKEYKSHRRVSENES